MNYNSGLLEQRGLEIGAEAIEQECLPGSIPMVLVGLGGFEPPTSPLSGVRSNQLSYRPKQRDDASIWRSI